MNWNAEINCNWGSQKNEIEIKEKVIQEKAIKRKIKNQEIHFLKAKHLNDLCFEPKKNEQWRIVTEKQFNAYALILHILQKNIIEEMYLAIYRINEPTVNSIIDLIEKRKIKKANFVISIFFNQTKKPEIWALKLKEFADKNKNVKHIYVHNHAKIVALKTNNENYFIFEGSGNMSDNARIEQYIYENNEKIFNFHKQWIENLIKNHSK